MPVIHRKGSTPKSDKTAEENEESSQSSCDEDTGPSYQVIKHPLKRGHLLLSPPVY